MKVTLGQRLAQKRREKGYTREELSEQIGVSPRILSEWESDRSAPELSLFARLAQVLGVSADSLLDTDPAPAPTHKHPDELVFRIRVLSADGDKLRVNLPLPLVKMALGMGMKLPPVAGNAALQSIDFGRLIQMAERGILGQLAEAVSADGDTVDIFVD
ncbi:MAG: helix-turn-helix transcriptional regulator [Eubacteriales bacterium]